MIPIRAFIVCVDYWDILSITLPYNIHHFSRVNIITSPKPQKQYEEFQLSLSKSADNVCVLETDLFYRDGATFNKWRALEAGLDMFGREGWICLMDADVLWPKDASNELQELIQPGFLYTPRRRMYTGIPKTASEIPEEYLWKRYHCHRNEAEFAGYSQIFHSSDPALPDPPWHEINWKHAGGADSFFQMRWQSTNKVRPRFQVLHLGEAGTNWLGRATPYADGTIPEGMSKRRIEISRMFNVRRSLPPNRRFDNEKIEPS